jgi:SAM-dependent methyltransferase
MSYSQRLLQKGNFLTRNAHSSRFSAVISAIAGTQYRQALDYGCGDGYFLKTAYDLGIIKSGIGVDLAPRMLSACQERFAAIPSIQFCQPDEISHKIPLQSCDLIICTETLEHVGNSEVVLDRIISYGQPGARLVISVPIEIGPSLLFKQVGRYFANLKGNYGYPKYHIKELFSASVLWDVDSFPSPHSLHLPETGHKGFDYRKIEKLLQQKVIIEQRIFSPFPWTGNLLNSTVIWLCSITAPRS